MQEVTRLCPLCPGIYARVSLGFGLARSFNNEFNRLFPGENKCPMIPGDATKCTISPPALLLAFQLNILVCVSD